MRGLKAIFESIRHVVTQPLTDLADVSLILESPVTDDEGSNSSPETITTIKNSIGADQAEMNSASEQSTILQFANPQLNDRTQNLFLERATSYNAFASIIATATSDSQEIPTNARSDATASDNGGPGGVDVPGLILADSEPDTVLDKGRYAHVVPISRAAAAAAMDARKAYETISLLHGSSAVFGDVHLSGQQSEPHIIRFEDCLGRRYKFPYERCRKWPQMQMLIHQAFLPMHAFMPHVTQGRYHLLGPDREIIMPEYWEHAITPGMLVSMKIWSSPDLETAAELTLPIGLSTTGALRFDEQQIGSLSLFTYPCATMTYEKPAIQSISTGTSLELCRIEGNAAFAEEDYLTAIVKFSKAISVDPSDHMLYRIRSRSYLAVESFDKALQDITKAIELKEESVEAWTQKGCVLRALQDYDAAQNAFKRALAIEPTNTRAQKKLELVARHIKRVSEITPQESMTSDTTVDSPGKEGPTMVRFEHIRILGHGAYGQVDEVREVNTDSVYARKTIAANVFGMDFISIEQRVKNEVTIMNKLRHNHISGAVFWYRSSDNWSVLMLPVADCDLRFFLEERCINSGYPYENMKMLDHFFGCLISALSYAHDARVKHEDIKPSNILVQGTKVYLTDFGTAKDFSELQISDASDYMAQGTLAYWAPEPRPWGRPADVFALGCVFAEMLTVRQMRSLQDFQSYRYSGNGDFGCAYRSNLPKVREWLKQLEKIAGRDTVALTLLEQTLEMLAEEPNYRLGARRLKRNLMFEDRLFCNSCL